MKVLFDEIVMTDYGQFDLVWSPRGGFDGNWDRFFNGQVNGLVGAADAGGVYLNLARRFGGSHVRAVLLDAAPVDSSADFEDVVEVSIEVPAGAPVYWQSWAGETRGSVPDLAPGPYRLRVSALGRDAAVEDHFEEHTATNPVNDYLLEFWSSPARADEILRTSSREAAHWHREMGGRH